MIAYIVGNETRTRIFHIEADGTLLCGRIAVGGYHAATTQELKTRRLCGLCARVGIECGESVNLNSKGGK